MIKTALFKTLNRSIEEVNLQADRMKAIAASVEDSIVKCGAENGLTDSTRQATELIYMLSDEFEKLYQALSEVSATADIMKMTI